MELQKEIDNTYPPTHTFLVKTLEPTSILKERMYFINQYFPDFFKGDKLLDLGCSKGFFSLSNSSNFKKILGVDFDKRFIEICNELKKPNTRFVHTSFKNFTSNHQFDRIYIGNAHHHFFKEINGHEWIVKLASVSSDLVLIEGPISTECPDICDFPEHFNKFMEEMDNHFNLLKMYPTVSYTPGRFFMLWKKKKLNFIGDSKRVIEKFYKKDLYKDNNKVSVYIASNSPISNGLIEFTDDGWLEEFNESPLYLYFENENEIFKLHCDHQIFLSRIGYYDMDSATINFFKSNNQLFDKSEVMPISDIKKHHIDGYFKLLNQSYKTISNEIQEKIRLAFISKDPIKIEEVFKWAKNQ